MSKTFFLNAFFILLMMNVSAQDDSTVSGNQLVIKLKEKLAYKDATISWDSLVFESTINPDGSPGEQFILFTITFQEKQEVRMWHGKLPSAYKELIKNNPQKVTFKGEQIGFKIIDANLETPMNASMVLQMEDIQDLTEYTIEGKVVLKPEFDKFIRTLKPDTKSWYCAETNEGGRTGYRAKGKTGKVYKVETESNSKGTFVRIRRD